MEQERRRSKQPHSRFRRQSLFTTKWAFLIANVHIDEGGLSGPHFRMKSADAQ
jgi:hypothetical protein